MSAAVAQAVVEEALKNVLKSKLALTLPDRRMSDALDWATEHARIVHPVRGLIPFEPYPYQARFLTDPSPRRLIVKARQIGFSLVVGIEAAFKATQYPNRKILIISRNQRQAMELLDYCYTAIAYADGIPELVRHNTQELEFANGSQILSLPSNRSAGRGFAATDVYSDEHAFQPYAAEVYRSIAPTLSHGGTLTVFSSADGRLNHFYTLWDGHEGGTWERYFIPWQECPAFDTDWYNRERPNYTAQQWASEFDCDFVTSGFAIVERAWWDGQNRYDVDDTYTYSQVTDRFMVWDTAEGTGATNAYTACVVLDVQRTHRRALVRDVWRGRVAFADLLRVIEEQATKWNHDGRLRNVVIENASSGKAAVQMLRLNAPTWLKPLIVPFPVHTSKDARLTQASVLMQQGRVWLPEPSPALPWLWDFEAELYAAPNSAYRDQTDALAEGLLFTRNYLRVPGTTRREWAVAAD